MTPDEAIRELCNIKLERIPVGELGELKALNLGIKALQPLENPTDPRLIYARKLLLGEIKEGG